MRDLADTDLFKCAKCSSISDIENSIRYQSELICECCYQNTPENLKQQNAELLAALEDMLEVFGGHSDEDCPAESRARTAIAKAKGE